jgi:hypothetical protein
MVTLDDDAPLPEVPPLRRTQRMNAVEPKPEKSEDQA